MPTEFLDGAPAAPTALAGTPAVTISGTPSVNAVPRVVFGEIAETTTALAANATYSGAMRDTGSDASLRPTRLRTTYRATAAASAAGSVAHIVLEESADNSAWHETSRLPQPADGGGHTWEFMLRRRYYRWRVVNGPIAQTALYFHVEQVRTDGPALDGRGNIGFPLSPPAGQVLSSSATITGPTLDLGTNHEWDRVRLAVLNLDTSASGIAYIEVSPEGTTFRGLGPTNVGAGGSSVQTAEAAIGPWRYLRGRYVNGSTAATAVVHLGLSLLSL